MFAQTAFSRLLVLLILSASILPACEMGPSGVTADAFSMGGDALEPSESAPDGPDDVAVLRLLNASETDEALLDLKVGLDVRAAAGLIAHRDGPDGKPGTRDDDIFNSIDEVDAVAYVGPATLDRLFNYALAMGLTEASDSIVESHDGVTFTRLEAQQVLRTANGASAFQLDDIAALDARATDGLINGRPFADLRAVAQAAHVGPSALRKLKVYAPKFSRSLR